MIPLEILWPGTEKNQTNLGIQVRWNQPLAQVEGVDHFEIVRLDHVLETTVSGATATATSHVLGGDSQVTWKTSVEQVGSEAETAHYAISLLQTVPGEVYSALIALGTEKVLSGIATLVRLRLHEVREPVGNEEGRLVLLFHPDLLAQMCREHSMSRYGLRSIDQCAWKQLEEAIPPEALGEPPRSQFLITVHGAGKQLEYLLDDGGTVHEHRASGFALEPPSLFLDHVPDNETLKYLVQEDSDLRWPSQDGTDRSDDIAVYAILDFERIEPLGGKEDMAVIDRASALSPEVGTQIDLASRDAVRRHIPELDSNDSEAGPYRVGPAADGLTEFFVASLITMGYVVNSIQAAQYAIWVTRWLKNWVQTKGDSHLDVQLSFPARVLVALCEYHVRSNYHPRAPLETDWFNLTDEFYSGYSSPAHPTGALQYLVTIGTRTKTYAYILEGSGKVLRHSVRERGIEATLSIPDLFEDN